MTAWEKLIAGSTLSSGTAWDHLNAQAAGIAGDIFIYNEIEVELMDAQFEIESGGVFDVELDDEFTVELIDEDC